MAPHSAPNSLHFPPKMALSVPVQCLAARRASGCPVVPRVWVREQQEQGACSRAHHHQSSHDWSCNYHQFSHISVLIQFLQNTNVSINSPISFPRPAVELSMSAGMFCGAAMGTCWWDKEQAELHFLSHWHHLPVFQGQGEARCERCHCESQQPPAVGHQGQRGWHWQVCSSCGCVPQEICCWQQVGHGCFQCFSMILMHFLWCMRKCFGNLWLSLFCAHCSIHHTNVTQSWCSKEVKTNRKCCCHRLFGRTCFIFSSLIVNSLIFKKLSSYGCLWWIFLVWFINFAWGFLSGLCSFSFFVGFFSCFYFGLLWLYENDVEDEIYMNFWSAEEIDFLFSIPILQHWRVLKCLCLAGGCSFFNHNSLV